MGQGQVSRQKGRYTGKQPFTPATLETEEKETKGYPVCHTMTVAIPAQPLLFIRQMCGNSVSILIGSNLFFKDPTRRKIYHFDCKVGNTARKKKMDMQVHYFAIKRFW